MTSIVERAPDGTIIYKSPDKVDIPTVDLMTALFDISEVPEDAVLHADAADPSRSMTKAQLRRQARRTARLLRDAHGVGAGGESRDVVMAIATGHFAIPAVFYGVVAAGGVFSPSSPSSTPDELAYQLRQTGASLLLCTADTRETALAAASRVGGGGGMIKVLVFGDRPCAVTNEGGGSEVTFAEASTGRPVPLPESELDWRRITDLRELEDSILCLPFSSGTTGLPKATRLSHRNVVAEACITLDPTKRYIARHKGPGYRSVTLAHLPAAHVAGVQGYLVNSGYLGAATYWMPRFEFDKFCEYVERYGVTSMFTVPPIFLLLAKAPLESVRRRFSTCWDAISGAAPMGPELQAEAEKRLGGGGGSGGGGETGEQVVKLRQTWGLSETTGSITVAPLEHAAEAPFGSVGCLIPHCSARIVDDEGKDVEPGGEGEIWVKGPVVTRGYFRNDAANAGSFRDDGWFCTGDVAVFRDGWFFIVDRKKELIKYKGNQVAPAELEAVLISHPQILDAAVIGVPGEGTEVPRAYVVPDPKKPISGEEVSRWFDAQGLSKSKKLRGGVVFVGAIPRNPSGKILRKDLRELARKEFQTSKL